MTEPLAERAMVRKEGKPAFSFLCWNILHAELTDSFVKTDPAHLRWEYRSQLIKAQLVQGT